MLNVGTKLVCHNFCIMEGFGFVNTDPRIIICSPGRIYTILGIFKNILGKDVFRILDDTKCLHTFTFSNYCIWFYTEREMRNQKLKKLS